MVTAADRARLCPACGMPLYDPTARRMRNHTVDDCAAERARVDAAFDVADGPRRVNMLSEPW